MNAKQMQAAIEAAIAKHANANLPGKWSVNSGEGYIQLIWSCDKEDAPEMYGDEPWAQWGGDAIIEAAGIGDYQDSGIDAYQDKFGEDVIAQWVQWNLDDDDE